MAKCKICGKEIVKQRYLIPICSDECFHIDFWNETLNETAIIINGRCYHDGGYKPHEESDFLGHAGRLFCIQMNDGREITTNNLWYNGEIPKERNVPDNAKFI